MGAGLPTPPVSSFFKMSGCSSHIGSSPVPLYSRSSRSSPGYAEVLPPPKPRCCTSSVNPKSCGSTPMGAPSSPSGYSSQSGYLTASVHQHGAHLDSKRSHSMSVGGSAATYRTTHPLVSTHSLPLLVSPLALSQHSAGRPPAAAGAEVRRQSQDVEHESRMMRSWRQQSLPGDTPLPQPSSSSSRGLYGPHHEQQHDQHHHHHRRTSPLPVAGSTTPPGTLARNPDLFLKISNSLAEMGWHVQQAKEAKAMAATPTPSPLPGGSPKASSRMWQLSKVAEDASCNSGGVFWDEDTQALGQDLGGARCVEGG